ncbi:hypothetical protein B9Z55_028325 [Caenorhabditis nigoni]|uniref:MRG domain-containing protein n=2 Tax=Caenorhabditis nigoni TaxID=1611254 RepID=A0A2G5SBW0_9PELO|nr:hypothetical protein B9Z55_028325 [Caenorhabditis nigoni]
MAVLRARHAGILDEVKLTDRLGKILVDDYKLVHSEKKVPRIPTEWTVVKILEEISAWLKNKRRDIRESYFREGIPVLPTEMVNIERLHQKYSSLMGSDAVDFIELKENVSGFNLSEYFLDRQSVQAKLRKEMEDVNVDQKAEDFVDEQDAHERDQSKEEFDYHENEPV